MSCQLVRVKFQEESELIIFESLDFTSPFDNHNENKTSKIWNQCDKNNYNSNLSNQENTPQNSTDYDILQV